MNKFATIAVAALAVACSRGPEITVVKTLSDGTTITEVVRAKTVDDHFKFELDVEGLASVAICPEFGFGEAGEDGWFFNNDGLITRFNTERKSDCRYDYKDPDFSSLAINGYRKNGKCWMALKDGMKFESLQSSRFEGGKYSLWDVYNFRECGAYEPLSIEYYPVDGDSYSDIALLYRKLLQQKGQWVSLREKEKQRPLMNYIVRAPEVRIRMGWKPSPSPVTEQTLETEPPMHVAVDFDRVCDIIDEFRRQGVEKVNICLVGWNIGGHDGRFPDLLPVDPRFGGEEGLKKALAKAKEAGYKLNLHSVFSGMFSISEDWNGGADVCKHPDGSLCTRNNYGGGNCYSLCFKPGYEKYFKRDIPRMAALGVNGMHYIDVLSIINPRDCHDPNHPLNKRQVSVYMNKMLADAQNVFGAVSSEGGKDFTCANLDWALYATRCVHFNEKKSRVFDEYLPIWHLVFNGSVLANPSNDTVNFTIKPKCDALKMAEYAGRPIFYFYAAFKSNGKDWMGGKLDLRSDDEKTLKESVAAIKEGCDLFKHWQDLQYETMDLHEECAPGIKVSTFSNGTRIVCNYTATPFEFEGAEIPAESFRVLQGQAR